MWIWIEVLLKYIYIYIIIINRDYTRDESKGGNGQTLTPTLIISAN